MKGKKELKNITSDVTTAGIPTGIMNLFDVLPPDLQTVLSLALPALACGYNSFNRIGNEKIAKKDIEKLELFINDLKSAMEQRQIQELQNFTNLDFPIEMYSVVEDIIKEAVNAKGKWLRKLAAHFVVIIGSVDHPNFQAGKQFCLEIVKDLNEIDLKLLLLYELTRERYPDSEIDFENRQKDIAEVKDELSIDPNVFAHTILISSKKLSRLGLVMRETTLTPYDDENGNKDGMINNFISLNRKDVTAYFSRFQRYIHGFIP